ncbi:TPA: conjugal transfer protein TrbI [Campylobacter fetus subsp. venerealis]|nr:conjugal transfer protein TrbI [Campylobacter fetus subsp. venerealis]HDX6277996.1 conjugal transfer protein TrbI [Campylobacter fetus subsp. venerealis]HDX6299728.1 conjugal transfer protein TrbI [Campylobacter fetus subsp. venerealis]HDX8122137.1 conjugal transfer protein TrbI [Campylobacter fetus subsp. venerealis]HDX8131902.1 conjugal transfer protein TrbI [Campylobacter fetus subsp. venerealis]
MLDADSSPTKLSNNKRLSKFPIIIIFIIIVLVLLAIIYAALSRSQQGKSHQETTKTEQQSQIQNKDVKDYINSLEELGKEKTKQIPSLATKDDFQTDKNSTNIEVKSDNPLGEPVNFMEETNQLNEFELRELELKNEMRLKALTSISKLDVRNEETNNKNTTDNYPNLDAVTNLQNQNFGEISEQDRDKKAEVFLSKKKDSGYLTQIKQKSFSEFELKAGWIIPAILITGINSDLPGEILAQISQNIYDTATGKHLLIPQGSKVVGSYSSNIVYGQKRILVAWNKIIFPNGDTLNLLNMQGTSTDGYSGFKDKVNNHYFRIFGSALLLSSITAGISLADKSDEHETETAADKAMSAAINQIGQVATEMIRKNMNIAPTLEIRPGYKFNIFVTKDIILEPLETLYD